MNRLTLKLKWGLILGWACSLLVGCSPEPNWDIDILAPVAQTTLTLDNLTGDTLVESETDGALKLVYEGDVFDFDLDTISTIKDITSESDVRWVLGSAKLPPGFTFPPYEIKLNLDLDEVSLTKALVSTGSIDLRVKSLIPRRTAIRYFIPSATRNGQILEVFDTVDASNSTSDTLFFNRAIDISGYEVNLTGNGNQRNQLVIFVEPTLLSGQDSLSVSFNQYLFGLRNTTRQIKPYYAKGFLSQRSLLSDVDTAKLDFFNKIKSGAVQLDEVQLRVDFINRLGADFRITPQSFVAINSRTGQSISLMHPVVGSTININRAVDNGYWTPVTPSVKTFLFDNSNSNLASFISVLPDQIQTQIGAQLNPYGNTFGSNDFFYLQQPPKVRIRVEVPLRFSASQVVFEDTIAYDLSNNDLVTRLESGSIRIVAENWFPYDLKLQLHLLDANGYQVDSLLSENSILPAIQNVNNQTSQPVVSTLVFPVSTQKVAALQQTRNMLLRVRFTTVPAGTVIQMYDYYRIHLKVIADLRAGLQNQ